MNNPAQHDLEATEAERLGAMFAAIKAAEWACSGAVCTYPTDGNCGCFNTALAQYVDSLTKTTPHAIKG
jgi:hypothetical protein